MFGHGTGLFGAGGPMANPFTDYLLGLVASDNPSLVASAGGALGVPPPSANGSVSFGNLFNPLPTGAAETPFPEGVFTGLGGAPGIGDSGIPQDRFAPASALAKIGSMAGVKAPGAVPAPIFNAGVSGSQKAPEVQASAQGGQQMLQLLKMLQGSAGPAATPARPLGSYF